MTETYCVETGQAETGRTLFLVLEDLVARRTRYRVPRASGRIDATIWEIIFEILHRFLPRIQIPNAGDEIQML